jgi:hypothetical protein
MKKVCKICEVEKAYKDFTLRKGKPLARCKKCVSKAQMERNKKEREQEYTW